MDNQLIKISKLLSELPNELQIKISEYNVEHRKQFYWALKDLKYPCYCDTCNKYIKKGVYSYRGSTEQCCSSECVDNVGYVSVDQYGDKWIYNYIEGEYMAVTSPSDYEYTNY